MSKKTNLQIHKISNYKKLKSKRIEKYGIKYVQGIYKDYTCIIINEGLFKPNISDSDKAFFEAVDAAHKEGKELIINKIRYRPL